ncbi:unnamed protein product [Timema podura]|uniref:Nose resistant-to-fluoxetine protein N-terminal domain-containing protein n=1 Tax=Timema podura TaxID=61482 RepID=A0ABN7NVS5_TIMPD|nr:unnamed protein product [Timema podura]
MSMFHESLKPEKVFDSSTKTPEGMVIGSTFNFGNFDECVGVRGPPRAEGEPEIQGQYCLMEVIMADPRVKPPEREYMEYHYILNYKLDGHKFATSESRMCIRVFLEVEWTTIKGGQKIFSMPNWDSNRDLSVTNISE